MLRQSSRLSAFILASTRNHNSVLETSFATQAAEPQEAFTTTIEDLTVKTCPSPFSHSVLYDAADAYHKHLQIPIYLYILLL